MKIKVCGITSLQQLLVLQELGIDYAGIIFYKKSKRYAGEVLKNHQSEIRQLQIKRIGVFVNEPMETVLKAIKDYELTAVQLHGDETDEYCLELMDTAKVIKVFRIADQQAIDELVAPYQEVCDYFLFDTDTSSYGGSGKQFNWKLLENANIGKPFFLSGGIGIDDVAQLKVFKHHFLFGVDVNSRLELSAGVKDMKQVADFKQLMD